MKKKCILITALIFFLAAPLAMANPWAGRGGEDGPRWGMGMDPQFIESLDLTQEQMDMIRELKGNHIKDTTPVRSKLVGKRAEMKLLWLQKEPDVNAIKAKHREIHELTGQMQEKSIDFRMAILNTLTPEQRTKVLALGLERGQKFRHKKGGERGMRKGPRK